MKSYIVRFDFDNQYGQDEVDACRKKHPELTSDKQALTKLLADWVANNLADVLDYCETYVRVREEP